MSGRNRQLLALAAAGIAAALQGTFVASAAAEADANDTARAKVKIAASHYGDMLAPTMMKQYVGEHPGLGYEVKYIEPDTPAEKAADLVLLIRVSEAGIREWTTRGYVEAHSGTAIGHNSFCVVVDPRCPLKEMSLADLKAVLGGSVTSWDHFGLPAKPLELLCDSWASQQLRSLVKLRGALKAATYPERLALAVAGNPDAIGFIDSRQWLPNTGLRIVRITPDSPKETVAFDNRLSILHRPDADVQVRALAGFLWECLRDGRATDLPAWAKACEAPPREMTWPAPSGAAFDKPVDGAAACLPIQSRLRYHVTISPQCVKQYEAELDEALAASSRLMVVNRSKLREVLAERRLAFICGGNDGQARKLLMADVVVEPTLVDDDHHAYLSIQAIHVPTGSLLGQMKLAIDPDRTGKFDLDLPGRIAAWWPGVLANLHRVRTLAIVSVRAAGQGPDSLRQARRLKEQISQSLAQDGHCYAAAFQVTVNSQTEMLMRAMGLAAAPAADRTVAFDYILEARLLSDRRAELRILSQAGGKQTASGTVEANSPASLPAEAGQWAVRHGAKLTRPVERGGYSPAPDDWFARQAVREFEAAEKAGQGITAAMAKLEEKDPKRLALASELVRPYLAAWHLDPTNEAISYRVLELKSRYRYDDIPEATLLTEAAGRYIMTFPNSKRPLSHLAPWMYWGLVRHFSGGAGDGFRRTGFPEFIEKSQFLQADTESRLQAYRVLAEWIIPASRRFKPAEVRFEFPIYFMDHYYLTLMDYLDMTKATDERIAQVVATWAQRYDGSPAVLPPSEFLRLGLAIRKGDKRGALGLLAKMIESRPDPADAFWTFLDRSCVSDLLAQIDQDFSVAARKWLEGKMTTEQLSQEVQQRLGALQGGTTSGPGVNVKKGA
jgi:hypothetical protein